MVKYTSVRVATRKSPLALWQAQFVRAKLQEAHPGINVELVTMLTKGDKLLSSCLAKVGGKGLFVEELERAVIEGRADFAVHSMKDIPLELAKGLGLGAICKRGDPTDAFVSNEFRSIATLPYGATVGTCSLRRQCQLKELRPDIRIKELRGNVGTRIGKLDAGEYNAIVLASSGLRRLGMGNRIIASFQPEELLPAVGQGAIGIECPVDNIHLISVIEKVNDPDTFDCVLCERAVNRALGGGCHMPVASYAEIRGSEIWLRALVGQINGTKIIRGEIRGHRSEAESIGENLAEELIRCGANSILAKLDGQ